MFRKLTTLLLCLFFFAQNSFSQELNCNVQVNYSQLPISDKNLFDQLQQSLFEFMNNRKWTEDVFKIDERIDCSILINLTEQSGSIFKGTIQIQSRRPVYGTSYMSTIFTHSDNDFEFEYQQFQNLEFADNAFISNLTSVLAFYAYMVIGYDYDTFSPKGGTDHFQRALAIVNNAQNAQPSGWKAFEGDDNRYWLIENHLNQRFEGIRTCLYEYHRNGLDQMQEKINEGRKAILESLKALRPVHTNLPNSFNMQVFFNAKADEIVNIFSEAPPNEKQEVVNLLSEINPANITKYNKILNNK